MATATEVVTNNMFLSNRNITKNVIDGIDFVMYILTDKQYPRNILLGYNHRPYTVWNRDDILTRYKAMLYEDCYLNAFPNYDWLIENNGLAPTFRPAPSYVMIDIDRAHFADDEQQFQQAVADTLENIKVNITGITSEHPIYIDSGNGYHIHVPLPGMTTSLENMPEFEAFWQQNLDLDNRFLRFIERTLSNGKSDQHHNLSVNSCMFRIPGTINSKARDRGKKDPYVTVIEGYKHVNHLIAETKWQPRSLKERNASRPTTKLLNDFYAHLIQERIEDTTDESDRRIRKMFQSLNPNNNLGNSGNDMIAWVEMILQRGVEDQRKDLLFWVLAPYLITVRKLDYDKAHEILEQWLDKCNDVRRLYPDRSSFRIRVDYCLKYCLERLDTPKPRLPVKLQTFKEYYPELYRGLFTR